MNNPNQLPIYVDNTISLDELTTEPLIEYTRFIKNFHKKTYYDRSPIILIRITRHISSKYYNPLPIIYFMNENINDIIFSLELEDNFWTITVCNEYGGPTNQTSLLSTSTSFDEILEKLKKIAVSSKKSLCNTCHTEN